MLSLLLLGILAGIDNLQVAAAVSLAPLTHARRMLLAAAFIVCEIASPILGVFIAHLARSPFRDAFDRAAPLIVLGCGVAVLWQAFTDDDLPLINSRWTLLSLPLSLSIDHVLIGVSAGTLGHPPLVAALTIGVTSALLCTFGVVCGARIRSLVPRHGDVLSGVALIVIAASMWIRS